MGLWSRLFGSGERASWDDRSAYNGGGTGQDRSLIDPPRPRPSSLLGGKAADLNINPWSATRLSGIFEELAANPGPEVLIQARKARHCLSKFWLGAPVDQLEVLYRSPIGRCYRQLLVSRLPGLDLESGEQAWRQALAQRLMEHFDRPETVNLLLAAMPYFARGKMRVANPIQQVPRWLLNDYAALFDPQLQQQLSRPAGLLGPVGTAGQGMAYPPQPLAQQPAQAQPAQPQPALTLPLLSSRRGNDGLTLVQNGDYIGRMNGLINLYSIDPSDSEVQRELVGLRRQLGQAWLDLAPDQLVQLFQSNAGQLYRNLLASGFAREALLPEDQQLRSQLASFVSSLNQPRAVNALLAALPFYPPGRIQLGSSAQRLPGWLLEEVNRYNGAVPAGAGAMPGI